MASLMPADEGERAKNTTCTDRNQVEHLLFMPVTPRAREGFFFNYFFWFVKEGRLYVELQCESAAEDVVTGSELVETHVDVPRLKVSLFQI